MPPPAPVVRVGGSRRQHVMEVDLWPVIHPFISMSWRGKPLTTYRTVVELIAATTTRTGLRVQFDVDTGYYPTGVKITDAKLRAVPIKRHEWHLD